MDNASGTHGTDYRSPAPFRAAVSRRRFLQVGGALAGAAAVGVGTSQPGRLPAGAGRRRRTGTIADLKHVVILMQENRSFDHYYGTLQGVRGFSDKQSSSTRTARRSSTSPTRRAPTSGTCCPSTWTPRKVDAQNAGDLDHSWAGDHSARNGGLWNNWVSAKTEQTMGYFTRNDLPFNYALADAFTICDGYHQSILGPTSPNRMYFWTGTSHGWTSNPPDYTVEFTNVTTYPELLLKAGISWQVYTNHEVGDGSGNDGWVGDYGDNPLWFYQQYQTSEKATTAAGQQLAVQGAVQPWQPNAGTPLGPNHVNHVLAQFISDCAASTIPQVSWIVAPYEYSEHPAASPSYGAHYVRTVLEALMSNQALWETTALFITYDEHDGYFDHVLPVARDERDERVHQRAADRLRPPGADDHLLAVDARRVRRLQQLRPHLDAPLPGDLDRRPGPQHHGLAAVGDRRPDRGVRLRQPGLLGPDAAGHGAADHPVRRGEVLPGRHAARRGRAGDAGPGTGHPAAPADAAHAARRRHRRPLRLHGDRDDVQRRRGSASRCSSSPTSTWPPRRPRSRSSAARTRPTRGPRPRRTATGTPSRSTARTGSSARSPGTSSRPAPPPGRSPG